MSSEATPFVVDIEDGYFNTSPSAYGIQKVHNDCLQFVYKIKEYTHD
jgi:hypothetical protein